MRRRERRRATTLCEVVAMTTERTAHQHRRTRVFSREIRTVNFPQRFCQPTTITKHTEETDPRVWLNDYRLAGQLGGVTTDAVIIHNLPLHLADSPGRGSSICSTTRSTVGTTWSAHLWETSRARTCASGTPGTYWGALRSPACRCGTSYDAFPSAILLTVKFRQPSHEFTFGVGMTFVSYPLVLTPVV
jgi:hypothetical protein